MIRRLFRRRPSWRTGLIHIHCASCGRSLDWAQPAFVQRYPEPRCGPCRAVLAAEAEERAIKATAVATKQELARETGRETARELFRLANPTPQLDNLHQFVVDAEGINP